jgi:hypothetical protein
MDFSIRYATSDLLMTVRYQVADVDDFIEGLSKEKSSKSR